MFSDRDWALLAAIELDGVLAKLSVTVYDDQFRVHASASCHEFRQTASPRTAALADVVVTCGQCRPESRVVAEALAARDMARIHQRLVSTGPFAPSLAGLKQAWRHQGWLNDQIFALTVPFTVPALEAFRHQLMTLVVERLTAVMTSRKSPAMVAAAGRAAAFKAAIDTLGDFHGLSSSVVSRVANQWMRHRLAGMTPKRAARRAARLSSALTPHSHVRAGREGSKLAGSLEYLLDDDVTPRFLVHARLPSFPTSVKDVHETLVAPFVHHRAHWHYLAALPGAAAEVARRTSTEVEVIELTASDLLVLDVALALWEPGTVYGSAAAVLAAAQKM